MAGRVDKAKVHSRAALKSTSHTTHDKIPWRGIVAAGWITPTPPPLRWARSGLNADFFPFARESWSKSFPHRIDCSPYRRSDRSRHHIRFRQYRRTISRKSSGFSRIRLQLTAHSDASRCRAPAIGCTAQRPTRPCATNCTRLCKELQKTAAQNRTSTAALKRRFPLRPLLS